MRPVDPILRPPGAFSQPFYFLRHGETQYNRDRVFQGQTDVPLNATGEAQAETAAALLKGVTIGRIVASPLARARRTADIVGELCGVPVETHPGLMECHLGRHQGEPYQPWLRDYWQGRYAPEGGEDFWRFRARVWPAMAAAAARPDTLIVAHGGLWYAARTLVAMTPDLARMPNALPLRVVPNGGTWDVTLADGRPAPEVADTEVREL